jgi:actin-like ATPase involved in cell morphogenesis
MDLKDKIEKISLPLFDKINLQGLETRKIESINKQILNCKIKELSKLLELQLTKMNSEQPQKITVDEESLTKSLEKSLGEILSENKLKLKKPINTPKPVSSPSRLMRCFGNSSSKD